MKAYAAINVLVTVVPQGVLWFLIKFSTLDIGQMWIQNLHTLLRVWQLLYFILSYFSGGELTPRATYRKLEIKIPVVLSVWL